MTGPKSLRPVSYQKDQLEVVSKPHLTPKYGVASSLRNAHILPCMLRFLRSSRLVFGRDLGF